MAGESPGVWTGRGARRARSAGHGRCREFAEVLAGRDPSGDRALRARLGQPRRCPGSTCCSARPNRSASSICSDPASSAAAAGAAHEAAVADAVGYLERNGLGVRRVRAGERPPPRHHRGGGRRLRPPDQPGPRSPPPHPSGGGQRGPGRRRPVVVGRHPAPLPAPAGRPRPSTTPRSATSCRRPAGRGLGAGARRVGGTWPASTRSCRGSSPSGPPPSTSTSYRARGTRPTGSATGRVPRRPPDKERGQTVDGLRSGWRQPGGRHGLDPATWSG